MRYCLFPFLDQYQLLINRSLVDGDIDYIMPLRSWYDAILSSERPKYGVEILPLDEDSMRYYDAIIILPFSCPHADRTVLDFILCNIKNKKTVYNFHAFPRDVYKTDEEQAIIKDVTCSSKVTVDITDYTLKSINATVIYNTSIVGGAYHADIESYLSKRLKEIGANVCVVSTSPIAQLCGYVPFPIDEFKKISLSESAKWINKFVHDLEEIRKPDVIIISMPESLISYQSNSDNIGSENYICTSAVLPDYTILNIALDNYSIVSLSEQMKKFQKRLNCGIDAVIISDQLFDSLAYWEQVTPAYEFFRSDLLEQSQICERLKESSLGENFIYNNQKAEDLELLFQNLLSKITSTHESIAYERIL